MLDELEKAVVGKRGLLETVLIGILADGHVLIEDVPGVAKTLTARSFAAVLQLEFSRVQFTPDLIPADITGSALPDGRGGLTFQPADLRQPVPGRRDQPSAPPKTQAAALEAMEERQVTVDGTSHRLTRRSPCWPPRTRSSRRAPTRCPRPSSTGSCCGSRWATLTRAPEVELLRRRAAPSQRGRPAAGARRGRGGGAPVGGGDGQRRRRRAALRRGPGARHPRRRASRPGPARAVGPGGRGPGPGRSWWAGLRGA
ncbi:MAG: AAA family ATPase [Acidimicrobiales bacterium]